MRLSITTLSTLALFALVPLAPAAAPPAPAAVVAGHRGGELAPATTGGIDVVDRALARLSVDARVLVVAAHPDDEDTSLLALVARGMGGEAAYMALSRGEGGQNLIGPELGVGLGLLRSRELLAARGIDGAHQYFSRAYDFGFTRSLEETLHLWPKDALLEDVVRVIRRFRPQVLVSIFPGVPIRTHGQHQAAGVVAHEAFRRAGEAGAFPELAAQGLPPFQPQALYRSTWFDREATTLEMPTGVVDPLTGKSIFQIAMASRSQHRSQDMGQIQSLGPRESRLGWESGGAGAEGEGLFAGIDTHLAAIASSLPEGAVRQQIEQQLRHAEATAREARGALAPVDLEQAVPAFTAVLADLRGSRELLDGAAAGSEEAMVVRLLDEKIGIAEEGLAAAAGVAVDAFADREILVPGEGFEVTAQVWNAGSDPVAFAGTGAVDLSLPAGWSETVAGAVAGAVDHGALAEGSFQVAVPGDAEPTVPYFLKRPLDGDLYDWSAAPPAVRGEPFGPPPVSARFHLEIAGTSVWLEREVVSRVRDQARGEVRRPLRVVPALEVGVTPDLLVWPTEERRPRTLEVTLTPRASTDLAGRLEVAVPAGWPAVPPQRFELPHGASPDVLRVAVAPPVQLAAGRFRLAVTAVTDDGRRFSLALPVVDYPHIRPTPMPEAAAAEVSAFDVRLPPLERVGYIRGASDRVPEFLREIGVPLELLGPRELADLTLEDLARYDVIVVGSRAYETDSALGRANGKLLEYARRGGLLLVQYQQYPFVQGGYAPYPLEIHHPHDRVTDETAPVTLLDPGDPVFNDPNRIGDADWSGWVQERGLYFAGTWDSAYKPLLAMADPGGPELRGSLLVAPLGKGHYVYTGLAFFRQLPAGVAGAYRLFANLLAIGKSPASGAGGVGAAR